MFSKCPKVTIRPMCFQNCPLIPPQLNSTGPIFVHVLILNPSGILGRGKNPCPARDLAELGTGRAAGGSSAQLQEQITQGLFTACRNEAVLLEVFVTTAKGTEPRLSQRRGCTHPARFSGDRRAEPGANPRPLTPPRLLREGAGVLWEMTVVLWVPPRTPGFP